MLLLIDDFKKVLKLCTVCKMRLLEYDEEIKRKECLFCQHSTNFEYKSYCEKEKKPLHPKLHKIIFLENIYNQMYTYCNLAKGEISGLGEVEVKGNDIIIKQIILLKQICSPASTVISEETINNFIYQFAKKGLDTQNWKLWWHTHYDFGVFWSMTDEDNIKNLITLSKNFLVSVVINKKGEVLSRLDLGGKEYSID